MIKCTSKCEHCRKMGNAPQSKPKPTELPKPVIPIKPVK